MVDFEYELKKMNYKKEVEKEIRVEVLKELKKWIKTNALCQTTYSGCWDDGDLMFKRSDSKKLGDWEQDEWDEKIKNFEEEFIDYEEIIAFIEKQIEENGNGG